MNIKNPTLNESFTLNDGYVITDENYNGPLPISIAIKISADPTNRSTIIINLNSIPYQGLFKCTPPTTCSPCGRNLKPPDLIRISNIDVYFHSGNMDQDAGGIIASGSYGFIIENCSFNSDQDNSAITSFVSGTPPTPVTTFQGGGICGFNCGTYVNPPNPWTWKGPPGFQASEDSSKSVGSPPSTLSDIYCIISNCYNTATFTTDTITGSGICGSQCCIGTNGGNSKGVDNKCTSLKENFRVCGDIGASAEKYNIFFL